MNLETLGWSQTLNDSFSSLDNDALIPARIFRRNRQDYHLKSAEGEYTGILLGRLHQEDAEDIPAVGDWVAIEPFDENQAIIHHLLPRFSAFYRKEAGQKTRRQVIATNINTVFLVSGLDNDFNIRRIERYLVQTVNSGAQPVVILNKADLCNTLDAHVKEVERVAQDVPIIALSALTGEGLSQLQAMITPGSTVAFVGSSGVGKSSLVNKLIGAEQLKTGAVREDDSRGRHTTSHRELFILPQGGLVMDTPGMRELQLWGDEEDLNAVFEDIEALASSCRFRDCQHESEPGCAVLNAIESGDLDEDRFFSYLKLRKEIAYLERRKSEANIAVERKRQKSLHKMYKAVQKNNPKR